MRAVRTIPVYVPVESVDALIAERVALEKQLEELPCKINEIQRRIDVLALPKWETSIRITPRQQEVLYWVQVTGHDGPLPNKVIADKLHVTERTVKFHISRLLKQFGKRDRKGLRQMRKVTLLALAGLFMFLFVPTSQAQVSPSVVLTWGAVAVPTPAALTYKVERSNTQNGTYAQIGNPSATTYTDTNVTRGSTYWYRVKASCPATGAGCGTTASPVQGDSATTPSLSAVIPNAAVTPPAPTGLTITVVP